MPPQKPVTAAHPTGRRADHVALQVALVKAWYFLYFGSQFTQTFIPVILQVLVGMPPFAIGVIMCARRVAIMLGSPLFTALCDLTRRARVVILCGLLGHYVCSLAIAFERSVASVVAILLVRDLFLCGVEPSVNAAVLSQLSQLSRTPTHRTHRPVFSEVRLFGSIGWGMLSFLVPLASNTMLSAEQSRYAALMVLQSAIGVAVIAVTFVSIDLTTTRRRPAPPVTARHHAPADDGEPPADMEEQALLAPPPGPGATTQTVYWEGAFCASAALAVGALIGAAQVTYFLYLAQLGLSEAFMGSTMMVGCFFEAVGFSLIPKWRSSVMPSLSAGKSRDILDVAVSMALLIGMMALYSAEQVLRAHTPLLVAAAYAAEACHGFGHALFLNAIVSLAAETAPRRWKMSAQGAVQSLVYGAGPSAGALLAGCGMDRYGAPSVYASVIVMFLVMFVAFHRVMRASRTKASGVV